MYLTSMQMSGSGLPPSLPDNIRNEIRNAVSAVQGNGQQQSLVSTMPPQPTGYTPGYTAPQPTGYAQPMMTGMGGSAMLQNNMNFANRMMPHTSLYTPPAGFESLSKNVKIHENL
jgi:hypothetical protein